MSRSAPAPLADQVARDRICRDLDTTLIVEAAAGTGKTTALVCRMVAALAAGRAKIGEVVAVTFTELAAGELKLRLRTEIERARRSDGIDGAARQLLNDALPQLEEARIGTIHSFCGELLRERLAPRFAGPGPVQRIDDRCMQCPPRGSRRTRTTIRSCSSGPAASNAQVQLRASS